MSDHVKAEIEDGVLVMTLARPEKKNALTQEMYRALSKAIRSGESDGSVRVHAILGAPGAFTAGNDIRDFLAHATGSGDGSGLKDVLDFLKLLPNVKKPFLAGVDGLAIGIGTTLLFHCDMVFATPKSYFATPFLDLGLVPEAGSSLLMPKRMGYARAFEMLVLGETYSAEQMQSAGLINALVVPEDLKPTVINTAHKLARKPPEALLLSRQLMRGDASELKARVEQEVKIFAERLSSQEARAAFEAFVNKSSSPR